MSWSTTSAPSAVSPDLKCARRRGPFFRLRILTRLNAWPLPGFTNSFSMIDVRIAVEQDLHAAREIRWCCKLPCAE